jgi:hypothetical protein
MTEHEWLHAAEPEPLLDYLEGRPGGVGDREARLFAVACCRLVWDLLPDDGCRDAVAVVERYADGAATARELAAARAPLLRAQGRTPGGWAALAVYWAALRRAPEGLRNVCGSVYDSVTRTAVQSAEVRNLAIWQAAADDVARAEARLLRECFGNPFHAVALDPRWLSWGGGVVRHLALASYEEEAFDRLPVLADALEEAGCSDGELLGHCRGAAEHVRGCWALDLLLGKR